MDIEDEDRRRGEKEYYKCILNSVVNWHIGFIQQYNHYNGAPSASGTPYLRKFSNLTIQQILVIM